MISERALDPQSVNAILKWRAEIAGLEPAEFSAHGLAIRLSDGGRQSLHSPARSRGAVTPSFSSPSVELLQQCNVAQLAGGAVVIKRFYAAPSATNTPSAATCFRTFVFTKDVDETRGRSRQALQDNTRFFT